MRKTTIFLLPFFGLYRSIYILFFSGITFVQLLLSNLFRFFNGPKIVRRFFERTGGSFIKAGQILSMRNDILPFSYCQELSNLLDNTNAVKFDAISKIIKKEWAGKKEFISINESPIASASIAQVHIAEDNNNQKYILKIKRPFVDIIFRTDIGFLNFWAGLFSKLGIGARQGYPALIREVAEALARELDFVEELKNIQLFRKANCPVKSFKVPEVYPEYSTENIICMEYFEGIWFKDLLSKLEQNYTNEIKLENELVVNLEQLSIDLFEIMLWQYFEFDFFHADPHPGNLILLNNGEIGFVDFGIVGLFEPKMKKNQINYLLALSDNNLDRAAKYFVKILEPTKYADSLGLKTAFKKELQAWIISNEQKDASPLEKGSASLVMNSVDLLKKYNFRFSLHTMLFYKSIFTIEHIILSLNPKLNLVNQSASFFQSFLYRSLFQNKSIQLTSYLQKWNNYIQLFQTQSKYKTKGFKKKYTKQTNRKTRKLKLVYCLYILLISLFFLWHS